MVSPFTGSGFASAAARTAQQDDADKRTSLVEQQLKDKNEQFRIKQLNGQIEAGLSALEQSEKLLATGKVGQQFGAVVQKRRDLLRRQLELAGRGAQADILLGEARAGAAVNLEALGAGEKAAATEAEQLTVRDVPQPDGSVKTMVLRGGQPIRQLGQGFRTQVQPDRVPGASSKERSALDESEIATRNALRVAEDVKGLVREGGAKALSTPGALASGTASLLSSVEGMAQLAGVKTDRFEGGKSTLNKDERADTILGRMKEAANISAELKSAIVNLAFSAALASGQSGRGVSDRDYERFVRELGAGAASPERFEKVLTTFQVRLNENFRTRFRVQSRRMKELQGKPIPDPLKELNATRAPASDVSKMTDEELLNAIRNLGK